MKSINEELINLLKVYTPEKESTAGFLMSILPLGKEAAYRRLRGEIQFTLDEATILCKKLNISLDLLMGIKQNDTYAFHLNTFLHKNPIEEYGNMLERIKNSMEYIKNDTTIHLYRAHRTLPHEFLYNYEYLSKTYAYVLYYQMNSDTSHKLESLSEIEFPEYLFPRQKASIKSVHPYESTLILDKRIFIDFIEIVNYFHHLGKITEDDRHKIKEELNLMVDDMEKCAATGLSFDNKKMNIHISHISFDCSYTYLESQNLNVASIGLFLIDYLSCENKQINENQKVWIKSLMRFSTLISATDEFRRKDFFQTQRDYINKML